MRKSAEIGIEAFCMDGEDTLWCVSKENPSGLYKIDLKTAIMDEFALLPDVSTINAFSNVLIYKDYFVFIPANEDAIVMFCRGNGTVERIPLPQSQRKIGKSDIKFFTGVIYEDFLFMFGYSYPGIVKMDLEERRIEIIDSWLSESAFILTDEMEGCFHTQYYKKIDTVYFPFMNADAVMEFNFKTSKATVHKVGSSGQRYVSIEWDGTDFWLIPRDGRQGSIVKWNPVRDAVVYYDRYPDGFNYDKYAFYKTVNVGKEIFVFANRSNMNISIDIETGEMKALADIYDTSEKKGCKYRHVEWRDGRLFFIDDRKCIWWDYKSDEKNMTSFEYGEKIRSRRKKEELRQQFHDAKERQIREGEEINLKSLMTYLSLCNESEQ